MTYDLDYFRNADIFDSRDVIERIAELEGMRDDGAIDDDEAAELVTLAAFASEAEGYAADWLYGEAFIADDYFETYARDLADDIGAIDRNAAWPLTHIDWTAAAADLRQDYTSVDLDGRTFWTR